jgi:putative PEP-CTERM system histidine kinase
MAGHRRPRRSAFVTGLDDQLAGAAGSLAGMAYLGLALLLGRRPRAPASAPILPLVIAVLAGAFAGFLAGVVGPVVARPAGFVETLCWIAFLAFLGHALADSAGRWLAAAILPLAAAMASMAPFDPWLMATGGAAVIGLFLVLAQGLAHAPGEAGRRLLLLGLGVGFTFDLVIAGLALADAPLLGAAEAARPLLRAALVPLIAMATSPVLARPGRIVPSTTLRRLALLVLATTLALLAVAAGAGWLGTRLGAGLALALGLPAGLFVLAAGLAPGAGSRLDNLLRRHLPVHRHDYRQVWPAFVDVLTGADPRPSDDLPERVIRAVAGTVGAAGGGIWLAEPGDRFRRLASLALPSPAETAGRAPALAAALLAAEGPLPMADPLPGGGQWPAFLPRPAAAWLALPLIHKEALFGLLVLAGPSGRPHLDDEGRELLRLVARQAASYLAEDETARQLADARQFESFTRRFAYVMHDLKNVGSELALTLANARRHRDNPAFYDDLLETLEASVDRLGRLIAQLRNERQPRLEPVALAPLLRRLAQSRADRRLALAEPLPSLAARVEADALEMALDHLIDNALAALDAGGRVTLGLVRRDRMATVLVEDDGPGLPPGLVDAAGRGRPFTSCRPGGLGLGIDQARNTVERVGGRFELVSRPGRGTAVALHLPVLEEAAGEEVAA